MAPRGGHSPSHCLAVPARRNMRTAPQSDDTSFALVFNKHRRYVQGPDIDKLDSARVPGPQQGVRQAAEPLPRSAFGIALPVSR